VGSSGPTPGDRQAKAGWVSLTPDDIEGRRFRAAADGYDRADVDAFLADAAATLRALEAWRRAAGAPGTDPFGALGDEVADILRAAERAAARKRDELEAELAARRAEADLAAEEARRQAERDHEQAKRLLVRAQQRADAIVAEAEEQARARVRRADAEARQRTRLALERARRGEEQLVQAEQAAADRLRVLRAELAAVIERVAGAADDRSPVLDLTTEELDLTTEEAVLHPDEGEGEGESGRAGILGVVRDPLDELVRAAVARAQDHPIGAGDDGDDPSAGLDEGGHPAPGTRAR
jgi:DivIVA domain-containing protein